MKAVLAPDSFKGSLTAAEAAEAMKNGILNAAPDTVVETVPMADGGEGTTDNLVDVFGGRKEYLDVMGPTGRHVTAKYGIINDNVCVVEVAESSGLTLVDPGERDPLKATTYGLGELIKDALDKGCRTFIVGLGGSATNDGGAGMAAALGYRFLDKDGNDIPYGGGSLDRLCHITAEGADHRIFESDFMIACDVKNPLCGENGASCVFGPQKGADDTDVRVLDDNLRHLADIVKEYLGKDIADIPGAGAAGGLGGGAVAFLNGRLKNGLDIIAEISGLEEKMRDADIVFTGEGKCDSQTLGGKTPFGVSKIACRNNVPVMIIAGTVGDGIEPMYKMGVKGIYGIKKTGMSMEYAQANAKNLVEQTAEKAYRDFLESKQITGRDTDHEEN